MASLVSPGVQVREIDLTNVVPAVSTSIGGYAGAFSWGPVEEVRTVSSEKDLAETFGLPPKTDVSVSQSFLTAASFLKYSSSLKVVRAGAASEYKNATSGSGGTSGLQINNFAAYEASYNADVNTVGFMAAKYPGTLGNGLIVSICPDAQAFDAWTYAGSFTAAPGSSVYAVSKGSSTDEMHIAVVDGSGIWSGTPGTVLETFAFVSQASDAVKEDGTSNFYKTVLNTSSEYVYQLAHELADMGLTTTAAGAAFTTGSAVLTYTMAGGTDVAVTSAHISTALDYLADSETVDVNLLFSVPDNTSETIIASKLASIAFARKDAIAFLSPPIAASTGATPTAAVKTWVNLSQTTASGATSYVVYNNTAVKVYDKYADDYRYIGAGGHIAGLCAQTDAVSDAWFSPAGFNRGQLLGVTKLAYNANNADRDTLYKANINPIISFPGLGTVLFGDKTGLVKPSAFDRINVRRLFIVLQKAISTAAKFQLFEFNDEFTRAQFKNIVEPFLRDVQGRRGIVDFAVICDSSNNTSQVVDSNEFVAEIYVKPTRAINYITLSFIATRSSVQFSELVG
jgi:phage tail sheath protein FI